MTEQLVYIVLDASWGDRSIEGVYTTQGAAETAATECRRWAAGDEYVVVEDWSVQGEEDDGPVEDAPAWGTGPYVGPSGTGG